MPKQFLTKKREVFKFAQKVAQYLNHFYVIFGNKNTTAYPARQLFRSRSGANDGLIQVAVVMVGRVAAVQLYDGVRNVLDVLLQVDN